MIGLSACQDVIKFSVQNRCSDQIEVDVHDVADPIALGYQLHWTQLPAGSSGSNREVPDSPHRLYVWVRPNGSVEVPSPNAFDPADLASPAAGERRAVAVIEGDLCPHA
jgi:hypothetical protein